MIDRKKLLGIAERWAKVEEEHASRRGGLMAEVKGAKEDLCAEAEAAGANKRAFKAAMKKAALLDKIEDIGFDDLDLEAKFDEVQLALGLLPDTEAGKPRESSKVVDIQSAAAGRA